MFHNSASYESQSLDFVVDFMVPDLAVRRTVTS